MDNVIIANNTISVKEYQGQRVVTFKDIDTVHNRPDGTARRNFNTNKKHFIEGEDYFVRNSYEAKNEYGLIAPYGIVLVTESGYLMLVKSFTDDLSWDVQRELVKSYFRVKQEAALAEPIKGISDYKYIDKTYNHTPVLTVADIHYIFNITNVSIYNAIYKVLSPNTDYLLLNDLSLRLFLNENPKVVKCRNSIYIIFKSGFDKLAEYFNFDTAIAPKSMTENGFNHRRGYLVQEEVVKVMGYIRRELKGVEALTYLIESDESPDNLINYQKILARKLAGLSWWQLDAGTVKLGIHRMDHNEFKTIRSGERGMRY